jgi:hypothetical protein
MYVSDPSRRRLKRRLKFFETEVELEYGLRLSYVSDHGLDHSKRGLKSGTNWGWLNLPLQSKPLKTSHELMPA